MNTNTLAKNYDSLTPRERLPLILAASARGDEVEADRLARSAPKETYRLPNYHGLGEGFMLCAMLHTMQLLDASLLLWRVLALQAETPHREEKLNLRLDGLVGGLAYLVTVHSDAWERFADELKVDPNYILEDLPGSDLKEVVAFARDLAFTPEEAKAWRNRGLPEQVEVEMRTVDGELEGLRKALEFWVSKWS
jgi:hypothetical protein